MIFHTSGLMFFLVDFTIPTYFISCNNSAAKMCKHNFVSLISLIAITIVCPIDQIVITDRDFVLQEVHHFSLLNFCYMLYVLQ